MKQRDGDELFIGQGLYVCRALLGFVSTQGSSGCIILVQRYFAVTPQWWRKR